MPFELSHGDIDCNHSGVRSESRGFSEKRARHSAKAAISPRVGEIRSFKCLKYGYQ